MSVARINSEGVTHFIPLTHARLGTNDALQYP